MKELVRHIEILLLDHDCVIVPQVGGFVTRNAPARYIEEEKLFLPPIRTVGFNEHLKADDGLLARSYKAAYHCTDAEARRMMEEQVRGLQQELWENGSHDLGSIGVLSLGEGGGLEFAPCQSGTVCPAYYGLDALDVGTLETAATPAGGAVPAAPAGSSAPPGEGRPAQPGNEITIRLKKSWIQNVAAVAAVVLLFFLASPDARNTEPMPGGRAEFAQLVWMPGAEETAPLPIVKEESARVTPSDVQKQKIMPAAPSAQTKATRAEPAAPVTGYCVVVASAISERNAEIYVERLHKNGYKEAQVYRKGHMVRVVFPGYVTAREARAKADALSDRSEEFASAWIYQIK